MPSKFDALADNDSESSTNEEENAEDGISSDIPAYEDLSSTRLDEETVLIAVYGDDFHTKDGPWGSKMFCVNVRPPDIDSEKIGSQLELNIQMGKKYPYLAPKVALENIIGLSATEQADLLNQLNDRCHELSQIGSVMVCELVQLTEDYLLSHNVDPTMSAYDTMKAREEKERKLKMEKEKQLHSFMDVTDENLSQRRSDISRSGHSGIDLAFDSAANEKVQRELDRRDAAFSNGGIKVEAEASNSVGFNSIFDTEEDEEDDNGQDDFQFDETYEGKGSNSRYESDFIELGLIGRGGGGTVFKVRNRLDRRIYAVKKVILQSEQGKMQEIGRLENSKLRREVTTISRMTHRHIVRYYQAWVEGGDEEPVEEEEESIENLEEELISMDDNVTESSDEKQESKKGFFASNSDGDSESDEDSGWSDSGDSFTNSDEASALAPKSSDEFHLLGTPLMRGLGFENQTYSDLFKRDRKESIASLEELGFHSSMMDQLSSQNTAIKYSNSIMYIQMEYCPRQLVTLLGKIEINDGWRIIRQLLEALVYIHKRKIIHRDLKPGNIFLDAENNVRLGDFGLATTRDKKRGYVQKKPGLDSQQEETCEEQFDRENAPDSLISSGVDDDITGGVGTTFYIAPEQAGRQNTDKGQTNYDMKADIFSLGVVIFEMFFNFSTRMERATILQTLRGDNLGKSSLHNANKGQSTNAIQNSEDDWKEQAIVRFPDKFRENASPEIQKLILWCLERSPDKRPSADQLLKSPLLPRQMDLDHRYLKEALQTIANPESESHEQIIKALFDRHAMQHVEITYDTDDVAKIMKKIRISDAIGKSRRVHPIEFLGKSLDQIGGFTSGDVQGIRSSALSVLSISAATSTLRRAKGAGKIAKGEVLRTATQYAAIVLAMQSATASAATGHSIGVLGADPRVVKSICDQMIQVFESHGAFPLRPPLLRPKFISKFKPQVDGSSVEPAELLDERGSNLLLPEDLQVNFARAIGRGGGSLSNVKRYEIGTSFLKSISGGHPREFLEASFDIIMEDPNAKNEIFLAETIMVVCQVFSIISTLSYSTASLDESCKSRIKRPMWILRLTHTKLADAILDICGVPAKDSLRRACYHILTCCTAPPPSLLWSTNSEGKPFRGKKRKVNPKKICGGLIELAIQEHGLPNGAATRLRTFFNTGCLPLPLDIRDAINVLEDGTKKLRLIDEQQHHGSRRQKRYEDVARSLRSLRNCIDAIENMGIKIESNKAGNYSEYFPAYISLDLGLRQTEQHYHGQIYYQAIMLTEEPESIASNDTLLSGDGKGVKFAEGGRYDDLVRRFRPPGNFATSQVDQYASAPIPICTGVRFLVGAFVERVYVEAALLSRIENEKTASLTTDTEILRRVLAVPYISQQGSVQCLVIGTNGFDQDSLPERAMVASQLWMKGISAEFIPHSAVMMSLLKRSDNDTGRVISDTTEWTQDQICDLCCLLHIPFVVIVQQHLLRDLNSVHLRHTTNPSTVQDGLHESFVPLTNLASAIKDAAATNCLRSGMRDGKEYDGNLAMASFDIISQSSPSLALNKKNKMSGSKDPKMKAAKKVMKKVQIKANAYIDNDLQNILVVDLPFRVVREFNSEAMFNSGTSIASVTADFITQHPKHRKTLKTFAMSLDFMLRRFANGAKETILSILVFALPDDRFDLLTLETDRESKNRKQNESSGSRKKEKSGRSTSNRF